MNAQIIISGKVSFRNKGVKDVSVTIKDSYDGSTTDQNGIFTFQTSEKGSQTLVFSHPKFVEFEKSIVIENRPVNVDADLKEQISEIDEVVKIFEEDDTEKDPLTLLTAPKLFDYMKYANGSVNIEF